MSGFLAGLRERAAGLRRRIAFPEAEDERTLQAVARLTRERWVQPVLIGAGNTLRDAVEGAGGDPDALLTFANEPGEPREALLGPWLERRSHRGLTRMEAEREVEANLTFAALLVAEGHVDGAVAGALNPTSAVLRAAITCIGTAPGIRTVSSSFYMVVKPFRGTSEAEVLTFTDAGVVPSPDAEQLADIACAASLERVRIVGDEPRVAFLSFSTKGSAEGGEVAKMREAVERFRQRMPDVVADGELQADAALIEDVARRKAPGSVLAGRANILVFPDLDAGNIAYKLVQRLAGATALGPILQGLRRPFNDLSRGASPDDIVDVACITALQGPDLPGRPRPVQYQAQREGKP